jgi:hypothetical protein
MSWNLSRSVKTPESINASYWSTVKRASGDGTQSVGGGRVGVVIVGMAKSP